MRIKNDKGQHYAVECETLEENNVVFKFIKACLINNFRKYITTDDNISNLTDKLNDYEIIKFKDWVQLHPNTTEWISLPIEDYNRLKKLEIKQEIKKLKKELKGL